MIKKHVSVVTVSQLWDAALPWDRAWIWILVRSWHCFAVANVSRCCFVYMPLNYRRDGGGDDIDDGDRDVFVRKWNFRSPY